MTEQQLKALDWLEKELERSRAAEAEWADMYFALATKFLEYKLKESNESDKGTAVPT